VSAHAEHGLVVCTYMHNRHQNVRSTSGTE